MDEKEETEYLTNCDSLEEIFAQVKRDVVMQLPEAQQAEIYEMWGQIVQLYTKVEEIGAIAMWLASLEYLIKYHTPQEEIQ